VLALNIGAMSVSPAAVPAAVARLGPDAVIEALVRHGANGTDVASDLGVPSADLRKFLWANPGLRDRAEEVIERRLDLAEKNVAEALSSEDSRRRDAASMFVLRNTGRARRRGWLTSAAGADFSLSVNQPREIVFSWRSAPVPPGGEFDSEREAALERARREGKQVVELSWGDPDDVDGKTIEHDPDPEPSRADILASAG